MSEMKQQLVLTDRELLEVNGVVAVENFDANRIHLNTNLGDLILTGEDLNICHLNLDDGEVAIKGLLDSLTYKDAHATREKGKTILSRLLK